MILVMCANAGIDRTYEVENLTPGGYHTPRRFRADAGGKGVNVARGLRTLGQEVTLVGFAGGLSRQFLAERLAEQGIAAELVQIGEESRLCINIVDPISASHTQIDEMPPIVTPDEIERLARHWRRRLSRAKLAIISGSAPRGVPHDFYGELVAAARARRVPVIVDARDQLLAHAVKARPQAIKPNLTELERLAGATLSVPEGVMETATRVLAEGVKLVIVSLGKRGAMLVSNTYGNYWVTPPMVDVVSPVGCGDALVAGFADASARREPVRQRLAWAVACGTAVVGTFGAALESRERVSALFPQVQVVESKQSDD